MDRTDNLIFNSSVTLRSFLNHEKLKDIQVLSGALGLKRSVQSITVLDNLDFWQYIRGGEIILSTGFLWKDNPLHLCEVIKGLNSRNAAGLCLKVGRFIDVLPRKVYEISDELSFPILSYPMDFAFIDILNPALSMIINTQAQDLRNSYYIHRTLTNLVAEGGGSQKIVESLHEITGLDVCFIDVHFKKRYYSGISEEFLFNIKSLPLDQILSFYIYEKVQIGETVYGFLILDSLQKSSKTHVITQNALIHGSTVLKLELQRKESDLYRESRRRDEFVFDLLYNRISSEEEIRHRSGFIDWDSSGGVLALILRISPMSQTLENDIPDEDSLFKFRDQALLVTKKHIESFSKNYCYTTMSRSIIFLINSSREQYEQQVEWFRNLLERLIKDISSAGNPKIKIGIGGFHQRLRDAHKSYKEAEKTLSFLGSTQPKDVLFWDELGLYKFFHSLDSQEFKVYFDSFLGKIVQYDDLHHSGLIDTLLCLLEHNWIYRETARSLSIHYNTVKYRINLIESILDIDTNDPETRLNLAFCLKIHFQH